MRFQCEYAAITHPGNVRTKNEDHVLTDTRIAGGKADNNVLLSGSRSDRKPFCIAVFDGMGGISAGEEASRIAADTAVEVLAGKGAPDAMMQRICDGANEKICDLMVQKQKRMGSTASMLVFRKGRYYLCNIGDSPVYRVRGGKLRRIYEEQTLRAAYEAEHGHSDPHRKFQLTQYLGIFPQEAELAAHFESADIREGDRFLLCSDGLSDLVMRSEICRIVSAEQTPQDVVRVLLDLALERGGKDNISIICAELNEMKGFFSLLR